MAKANFRGMSSLLSKGSSSNSPGSFTKEDIVKEGVLKKAKKMKKRYFVLRKETSKISPSRLEYYESKRKFESGSAPRRYYLLKDCFISRKVDPKSEFCFALFNKDCIALIAESKEEMLEWMKELNHQKHLSSDANDSAEHVWRVDVQNRGVGSKHLGAQLVILTKRSLWLVRCNDFDNKIEIVLNRIRRCGHTDQFFFVEIGRNCKIGAGILWMKTEDRLIAENMNNIIYGAMIKCGNDNQDTGDPFAPLARWRVNSLTDPNSNPSPRNRSMSESGAATRPGLHHFHQSHLESVSSHSSELSDSRDHNMSNAEENEYILIDSKDTGESSKPFSQRINFSSPSDSESAYVPMDKPSLSDSSNSDYLEIGPDMSSSMHSESSFSQQKCHSENPYLDMTQNSFQSATTPSSSIPIPMTHNRDYAEMSPQSESSTSTSRTTSSDQLQDKGSQSTIGSGVTPDDIVDRPIRTSSVGSKHDPFQRKTREDYCNEPKGGRTRAFTIGSHTQYNAGLTKPLALNVCSGRTPPRSYDPFPSIREASAQNKSCSTPYLLSSPVSHSWSGSSGAYFRQMHTKEDNRMMLDFSKSGSIGEEKDKKGLCGSLNVHRLRSNSKSSCGSNQHSSDLSDYTGSYCETKGVDIPSRKKSEDYFEIGFNGSPHSHVSHEHDGYLTMTGSKLTASGSNERKSSNHSSYMDLSSPNETSRHDGYVDMTQSNNSVTLSSPTQSVDIKSSDRQEFRLHSPLSLDLSSPHSDFMTIDAFSDDKSNSRKRNSRKNSKKTFKEGAKSRKSDPGSVLNWSSEDNIDNKSKGPFSTIANLINRKSIKSPVSPQLSLGSRMSLGNTSPFASLTRNKNKDRDGDITDRINSPPLVESSASHSARVSGMRDTSEGRLTPVLTLPSTSNSETGLTSSLSRLSLQDYSVLKDTGASSTSEVFSTAENRNYVNMSMSPTPMSPKTDQPTFPKASTAQTSLDPNYMLMDGSAIVDRSRDARETSSSSAATSSNTERSRSLSGPSNSTKPSHKKLSEDSRTLSACSSPVSTSPPLSPNLGSVSSLSEGGLSSASSTCTVINVGVSREATVVPQGSVPIKSKDKSLIKSPVKLEEKTNESKKSTLNYVSLDLIDSPKGPPKSKNNPPPPPESSYTEIDFVKSEGLRNTTLGRDSNRQ